jgi:hypothetical protein
MTQRHQWFLGLTIIGLLLAGEAAAQDRTCPDGGKAYFGYCPTDRPAPNVLQQQLEQWAFYPREVALKTAPDRLEQLYTNQDPQGLYEILAPYDRATILATPSLGAALQDFKNDYYAFRQNEIAFENQIFEKTGSLVTARMADAWREEVNYYLLRANGNSADQLKKGPQITLDLQMDEAERVFGLLNADAALNGQRAAVSIQRGKIETASAKMSQQIKAVAAAPR